MMEQISEIINYAWGLAIIIVSYFLKETHNKFKESEIKILQLQLEVQKQATENDSTFKMLAEVKSQLRDLNKKMDTFMVHFSPK